jgi:TonB family protein
MRLLRLLVLLMLTAISADAQTLFGAVRDSEGALGWIVRQAQVQVKPSSTKPVLRIELVVLSGTGGVDFSTYMGNLYRKVRTSWFAAIPESAIALGNQAKVIVHFKVQKDGRLSHKDPIIEVSSGDKTKDKAATVAIRTAAPFERLPDSFGGQNIELRITFTYGVPPELAQHP